MSLIQTRRDSATAHQAWSGFDNFTDSGRKKEDISPKKLLSEKIIYTYEKRKKIIGAAKRKSLSNIIEQHKIDIAKEIERFYRSTLWGKPCKNMFRSLSMEDPDMLSKIIRYGELRETLLTYALEELGRGIKSSRYLNIIIRHLSHPDSVVREGAVYGLTNYTYLAGVVEILKNMLIFEKSRGVKEAIEEAVEGK